MKKSIILISAVALMVGLSACGKKEEAKTTAASSPAAAAAAGAQQVNLTATNWKFDQAEYKVKKGQPVTVTLKNAEGVHGIKIDGTDVKLENNKMTATFTPDKAGKFDIVCSIPCGTDHIKMKSVLVVE